MHPDAHVSRHIRGETDSEPNRQNASPALEMYGLFGMPELIPPSGVLQPSSLSPVRPPEPGGVPGLGIRINRGRLLCDSPQRRIGQRAPMLGQIGRSKRVEIEDEDLDNIVNSNGTLLPMPLNISPVA